MPVRRKKSPFGPIRVGGYVNPLTGKRQQAPSATRRRGDAFSGIALPNAADLAIRDRAKKRQEVVAPPATAADTARARNIAADPKYGGRITVGKAAAAPQIGATVADPSGTYKVVSTTEPTTIGTGQLYSGSGRVSIGAFRDDSLRISLGAQRRAARAQGVVDRAGTPKGVQSLLAHRVRLGGPDPRPSIMGQAFDPGPGGQPVPMPPYVQPRGELEPYPGPGGEPVPMPPYVQPRGELEPYPGPGGEPVRYPYPGFGGDMGQAFDPGPGGQQPQAPGAPPVVLGGQPGQQQAPDPVQIKAELFGPDKGALTNQEQTQFQRYFQEKQRQFEQKARVRRTEGGQRLQDRLKTEERERTTAEKEVDLARKQQEAGAKIEREDRLLATKRAREDRKTATTERRADLKDLTTQLRVLQKEKRAHLLKKPAPTASEALLEPWKKVDVRLDAQIQDMKDDREQLRTGRDPRHPRDERPGVVQPGERPYWEEPTIEELLAKRAAQGGQGKTLTPALRDQFMQKANGDIEKAKRLAQQAGYAI